MCTSKGTIESHLMPKGFYKELNKILHSNKDFTTTNYLLQLTNSLPKVSIFKESQESSLIVNIAHKPSFLRDIPSSVTTGSVDAVYYLSTLNKTFRNLYQLKSVSSKSINLNNSFEKGDLMFLQVIDKVMILWNSNDESLEPIYINLNNLKKFRIIKELKIELEISKRNESWNKYSLITSTSKSENLMLNVELKRIQLVSSFIKILRFILVHNINKISTATTTVSASSQLEDKDLPKQGSLSLSSESQLSNVDFSRVGLDNFPNGQKQMSNRKSLSKRINTSCTTSQSNLDLGPTIKEKLRNYKTKDKNSLNKPPINFFGEDPLSIEPLQSEDDSIKFQDFLENNKQRISRASSIYCAQPENILPTPNKIINNFHKVSKRYGKKTKKQSHKRDIWDFSSSVPSSPLKKTNLVTNSIRSTKSAETENIAQSIIPDSLASPTLLECSRNRTINEETKQDESLKSFNNFATKSQSRSKSKNDNSSANIEPSTPKKSRNEFINQYDNLLDNLDTKKSNSIQVGESSTSETYDGKSIRSFLDIITKPSDCSKSVSGNTNHNVEIQEKSLNINTPTIGNSTTFLEMDKRNADLTTTTTDNSRITNAKSITSIQKNIDHESSLLEDTTIRTSLLDHGSMFKEHDINRQYSLIHESMNLISSNLINRIKKFENDIFAKQNQLHEELEVNFKEIARKHCENLKNFNNYVKKKSDEIFEGFQ